jgi:hypothetical protein
MKYKTFYSSTYKIIENVQANQYISVYLTDTVPSPANETVADLSLITLTNFKRQDNNADPVFFLGKYSALIDNQVFGYVSMNFVLYPNLYSALDTKAYGGSVGPFRYIVFADGDTYSDTSNKLLCYFDYGFSRSLTNGQQMSLSFPLGKMYTIQ